MHDLTQKEFSDRCNARAASKAICKNCSYWQVKGFSKGECRHLSPSLRKKEGGSFVAMWPETSLYDGCGNFKVVWPLLDDVEDIVQEDVKQHVTYLKEDLRLILAKWKIKDPWSFGNLLKQVIQGQSAEAYITIRRRVVKDIPDFDQVPTDVVIAEVLRLDSVITSPVYSNLKSYKSYIVD